MLSPDKPKCLVILNVHVQLCMQVWPSSFPPMDLTPVIKRRGLGRLSLATTNTGKFGRLNFLKSLEITSELRHTSHSLLAGKQLLKGS